MISKLELWNFGKFHNKDMTLAPGLNLMTGPNEAGKSTIRAFILAVLYGFSRDSTKARLYSDDYQAYFPLEGRRYDGAMEVILNSGTYRIERNFLRERETCRLIHLDTGQDISDLPSLFKYSRIAQPGAFLFGLSQDRFLEVYSLQDLVFRGTGDLGLEVKRVLENYQASGSSKISLEGAIGILEEEDRALGTARAKKSPLGRLEEEIGRLEEEEALFKVNQERFEAMDEEAILASQVQEARSDLAQAQEEEAQIRSRIQAGPDSGLSGRVFKKRTRLRDLEIHMDLTRQDMARLQEGTRGLYSLKKSGPSPLLVLACLVPWLIINALARILNGAWSPTVLIISSILALLLALGTSLYTRARRRDYRDLEARLEDQARQEEEVFRSLAQDLGLEGDPDLIREGLEALEEAGPGRDQTQALVKAGDRVRDLSDRVHLLEKKRILASQTLEGLEEAFSQAKKREDRLVLLRKKREEVLKKKDLIKATIAEIRGVGYNYSQEAYQDLIGMTGQVFNYLTGGRYRLEGLEELENLQVLGPDRTRLGLDKLSQGTLDQAYLALRISLAHMEGKGEVPLIFDDSLVYFDDQRLAQVLDLFLALDRQVIIFSAHMREREILERRGADYCDLKLR